MLLQASIQYNIMLIFKPNNEQFIRYHVVFHKNHSFFLVWVMLFDCWNSDQHAPNKISAITVCYMLVFSICSFDAHVCNSTKVIRMRREGKYCQQHFKVNKNYTIVLRLPSNGSCIECACTSICLWNDRQADVVSPDLLTWDITTTASLCGFFPVFFFSHRQHNDSHVSIFNIILTIHSNFFCK